MGGASRIDRKAVVTRHSPILRCATIMACSIPTSYKTIGNGEFGFSADVTGLQTFNSSAPLSTMAQWGWHTTPVTKSRTPQATPEAFKYEEVTAHNRSSKYPTGCVTGEGKCGTSSAAKDFGDGLLQSQTYAWLRANPHRLNLGRLYLRSPTLDLSVALGDISQKLTLWSGRLESRFSVTDSATGTTRKMLVVTVVHPQMDAVSVRLEVLDGGVLDDLQLGLDFPYGNEGIFSWASTWGRDADHSTRVLELQPTPTGTLASFLRVLDANSYGVVLRVECGGEAGGRATLERRGPHSFTLSAHARSSTLTATVAFANSTAPQAVGPASRRTLPSFEETLHESAAMWEDFWSTGAAVDFGGSADPRAHDLENRIVMSQFVQRSQEAGSLPPQETGLVANSWYGKFHGEMRMWHSAHFAAWGRVPLLERSNEYYLATLEEAEAYARMQGYEGARWWKMRAATTNVVFTGPSSVGPLLLQEQPHPIVYAELMYRRCRRSSERRALLAKYARLVESTAAFMASFALRAEGFETRGCLNLGPPMAPGMGVEGGDPGNEMNWTHTVRASPKKAAVPASTARVVPAMCSEGAPLTRETRETTYVRMTLLSPCSHRRRTRATRTRTGDSRSRLLSSGACAVGLRGILAGQW